MSSYYLGDQLKNNMMAGVSTRTKSAGDYNGSPIPPCGDFARSKASLAPMLSPWLPEATSIPRLHTSVHNEITKFMQYMEPTTQEAATRKDLVKRFTNLITSFRMDVKVSPVGSYVTGLYLPTSDIDMVLTFGTGNLSSYLSIAGSRLDLSRILIKIRNSGFASKVEDVLNATVPLIRITDKVTGIEIDLTAADTHGIAATEAVQKWMKGPESEIIKMLAIVVKMFLSIRRCGTTYTGGVNSYVLVWMVVAWVKLEWPKTRKERHIVEDISSLSSAFGKLSVRSSAIVKLPSNSVKLPSNSVKLSSNSTSTTAVQATPAVKESKTPDFGQALLGFLKFYGNDFDYYTKAINIEPTPSYQIKKFPYSRYPITQRYLLSIFDPANSSIDMGSKAYGIRHVQASFLEAYNMLVDAERKTRVQNFSPYPEGVLGKLLGGDFTKFVEKRKRLGYSMTRR
ncbi:hypothetical protein BDZ97DRAFT_1798670 [Flammula alnicola]|nr:hypothetical protein BDZ97DRAFT_1798670 [Flammula alnicola]